jgi:Membrane protein involved in the export of O-antigen and teichoic acid
MSNSINEKSDFSFLLKHAKNYFGANLVNKAVSFISIPLFTRLLSPAEYGIINIYRSYVAIAVVLLTLNTHAMIGRYYYEESDDFEEFLGTTICLSTFTFLFTSSLYLFFIEEIIELTKLPPEILRLILVAAYLAVIFSAYNQIVSACQESRQLALTSIIQNYSGFLISAFLLFTIEHNKYFGVIYGSLFSGVLMSFLYIKKILKYTKFVFRIKHCVYIIRNSFPLIPYSLSGIILAYIDRVMIGHTNLFDAGLYSFSYNVASILTMISSAMQTAFMPNFFSYMNKCQYERLYKAEKSIFDIMLFCALGIIFYANEIIWILADKKYHSVVGVIPPVVIGLIFFSLFSVYGKYIGYCNKNVWSTIILLSAGTTNIILNYYCLPIYGYIAAAYTTALAYFLMFLMTWFVTKYILAMPVMPLQLFAKTTTLFFIFGILVIVSNVLIMNYWLIFLIKTVLMIVFLLFIIPREFLSKLSTNGGQL